MEKLRILISALDFSPQEPPGIYSMGGRLAWKLVEQLSQEYTISVITHAKNREKVMEALGEGALPKVSISFVEMPRLWSRMLSTDTGKNWEHLLWQKKALQLARWLHQENRFDAAHQLTPRYDWIPSYIGAFLPVPFIWGPLGGGEKELSPVQKWGQRSHVWKKCSERAAAILVNNQKTKALFPDRLWKKVQFFPWGGISRSEFPEAKKRVPEHQPFRIISASLNTQNHNLDHVLKAYQYFSNTYPNSQLQLLCQNGSRSRVLEMVAGLGLEEHVELLGWIPRLELRQIFRSGDIFVSLDTGADGASLFIDAMSSGLPVVGLDEGGPGILIQEGWGEKISAADPPRIASAVAQSLERLFKEKVMRRKLGRAARKNVKDYYLWESLGGKLGELYAEHFLQEENIRFAPQGDGRFFY